MGIIYINNINSYGCYSIHIIYNIYITYNILYLVDTINRYNVFKRVFVYLTHLLINLSVQIMILLCCYGVMFSHFLIDCLFLLFLLCIVRQRSDLGIFIIFFFTLLLLFGFQLSILVGFINREYIKLYI